jgi:hypothetical protein
MLSIFPYTINYNNVTSLHFGITKEQPSNGTTKCTSVASTKRKPLAEQLTKWNTQHPAHKQ